MYDNILYYIIKESLDVLDNFYVGSVVEQRNLLIE